MRKFVSNQGDAIASGCAECGESHAEKKRGGPRCANTNQIEQFLHQANVMHVDFEGQKHKANLTRAT